MPTDTALLELQLEILLDLADGWVLKEARFAYVMSAREKDHRMTIRRDHEVKANATNVRLYLVAHLLVQLVIHIFLMRGTNLLCKVDCISFYTFL